MARKRKKMKIRLIHMVICFLVIYITLIFWNQRKLMDNLEARKQIILAEIDELENDIDELNEEIQSSDTLQFVEKVARDDLGMVKPREIIYIDKNKKKNPFFTIRKKQN